MTAPALRVADLRVSIGRKDIVRGLDFSIEPGGTLGIVGESGSGKSMTVLAATGLLDAPGARVTGTSTLNDHKLGQVELIGASARTLRSVHGNGIGFVFQDPSTSLNPLLTLGRQLTESLETHRRLSRRAARTKAIELLDSVGIPEPEARFDAYPHELSGGQRQRVMIAIALSCDPGLLVADEPTTALDVTTQAQIIDLVRTLQHEHGTAVIWISHDMGVISQVADEVLVMRHGEAVERRSAIDLVTAPRHPYTRELLAARPRLGKAKPTPAKPDATTILQVSALDVRFPIQTPKGRSHVHAVDGVSFELRQGTTLGIVGESGSGKSTIANALTGLVKPTGGTATLEGLDVLKADNQLRRRIAMVFQDPFSSLDPRMSVGQSVAEPLRVHRLPAGGSRSARIDELFDLVELPRDFIGRYPHELSGGQRQRVSIARALALEPDIVILDESTASLDVSIQSRVLELLRRLQDELSLSYLFIAHDLAIVEEMSHDVLVMQRGRIVEHAAADEIFGAPREDYTKQLLAAIPPELPRSLNAHSS
ncbi:ABC transporter ATP-binding protein [Pseudoclavibacter sp. 8L]|uniref:ABC transporter ATP-binding protein n=1 Tax=Pseudoclavibacter sp. 8L TaxID=2653162 RepID=UPI0012F34126|nr:ABC transporter ATP-binding protein [Pseudoclavibacter sp. 8L]VXB91982.1 putative peptide transport fused subunits of ABC superfamily: ATP-binding components [Pseudoclavibacter sp. 8L]